MVVKEEEGLFVLLPGCEGGGGEGGREEDGEAKKRLGEMEMMGRGTVEEKE